MPVITHKNRLLSLAFLSFALLTGTASGSFAKCFEGIAPASTEAVGNFLKDPKFILDQYPRGGSSLLSDIRNLVVSNPDTLRAITGLVAKANPQQKSAIAAGLGQAAIACQNRDPVIALEIQRSVAALGDSAFETAFLSVTGNVRTAATGGPGGGGGGGAGSTGGLGGAVGSGSGFGGASGSGGSRTNGSLSNDPGIGGVSLTINRTVNNQPFSGIFKPVSP